jgi:ATP-dependent Clp protease ATP-binding subunit ClpA
VQQIVGRARELAVQQAKPFVGTDHLLAALLEHESAGVRELRRSGLQSQRVQAASAEIPLPSAMVERGPAVFDLVAAVRDGAAPPVAERPALLRQLASLLAQPRASVVLLGEPGVGRRSLVTALAQQIAREPVPGLPQQLWAVRPAALLDNPAMIVRQGIERAAGGLLALPDLHQLFGASNLTGFADAGVALKQALLTGSVRAIGTSTPVQHTRYLDPDPVLRDYLYTLLVPPATEAETLAALEALRPSLEKEQQVRIDASALKAA